jgi:TolA-binding protein
VKKLILILAMISLTACLQTREDIQKENEERQLKEQVSSIQKSHADADMKYGDIETEIRAISGRVEVVEHNQQIYHQQDRQDIEGIKKAIDAQNEKIKSIEQHLDQMDGRLTQAIQAMANAPAPSGPQGGAVVSDGGGKKGDVKTYNEGEALFSKKEFKKALVKFQTYREKNPKGPKAAESTYKIGVCLVELGLKKEAKEIYQETVDTYPGTPSAKKAKFRLTQLK